MSIQPGAEGTHSRAVLITGCSSGIGEATARHLTERGWAVYATARKPATLAALQAAGCRALALDVCDEGTMRAAVEAVECDHGAVGVLINNAGYGLDGPVEELDLPEMRRQFETNLFGPTRLTQLVIPGMRRQRWGRIVNVSSVGGRITTPGAGAYHASKHALESLSDALRFEVRGFGIDVVVVEPGAIRTRWVEKVVQSIEARADAGSIYAAFRHAVASRLATNDAGPLALFAGESVDVARVIEHAITARRPATRYTVPASARLFSLAHRWMPDRWWDLFLRTQYPRPGT